MITLIVNKLDTWITEILPGSLYHSYWLFYILFFVIVLFAILAIEIPIITNIFNVVRAKRNKRRVEIEQGYKKVIYTYLQSDSDATPQLVQTGKRVNKKIALSLIYELLRYVKGTDRLRLEKLFVALGLGDFIVRKLKSPFCLRKAFYLKRLSVFTSSTVSLQLLRKFTKSRFVERRLYAMQALIAVKPELIEPLFKEYTYSLSFWEQLNYYDFFVVRGIPLPDFRCLDSTKNTSVLVFGIRMIRLFGQKKGSVDSYKRSLKNPNEEVQIEIYKTLAEFGYQNIDEVLPELKMVDSPYLQQQIITYLSKAKSATIALLMDYYEKNNSPEMQLHILYCMYNFVAGGKQEVERFAHQKEDQMLNKLSNHLITNVL